MLIKALRSGLRRQALGLALAMAAGLAQAGPKEDFAEGEKAYDRGDVVTAMDFLRKAADAGHARAQARLGFILDRSEFDDEAVKYFRLSARQGDAEGEYGLATMYISGEGVKKDMAEAKRLLIQSAGKGHAPAVQVLAGAYIKGELQMAPGEEAQVSGWLRGAADGGYLPAIDAVVKALEAGTFGFAADAKLAAEYRAKADELRGKAKKPRKEARK